MFSWCSAEQFLGMYGKWVLGVEGLSLHLLHDGFVEDVGFTRLQLLGKGQFLPSV